MRSNSDDSDASTKIQSPAIEEALKNDSAIEGAEILTNLAGLKKEGGFDQEILRKLEALKLKGSGNQTGLFGFASSASTGMNKNVGGARKRLQIFEKITLTKSSKRKGGKKKEKSILSGLLGD